MDQVSFNALNVFLAITLFQPQTLAYTSVGIIISKINQILMSIFVAVVHLTAFNALAKASKIVMLANQIIT